MDDLEWAMQSMEQGTMPSCAGDRSVVRTRHQSGLSWSRSRTSTVWPRRTDSSPLLPLLATKSWITTVNSQPPESCNRRRRRGEEQVKAVSREMCGDRCILTNKYHIRCHWLSRSIIKLSRSKYRRHIKIIDSGMIMQTSDTAFPYFQMIDEQILNLCMKKCETLQHNTKNMQKKKNNLIPLLCVGRILWSWFFYFLSKLYIFFKSN